MTAGEVRAVMLGILDEVVRLCEKNQLKYYIIGGTLLGAVRHKGFIPWDDDIDIAMPRRDFDQFQDICAKELMPNYEFIDWKSNWRYRSACAKIYDVRTLLLEIGGNPSEVGAGVFVDIFPLDGAPESSVVLKWHHLKIRALRLMLSMVLLKERSDRVFWKQWLLHIIQAFMGEGSVIFLRRRLEELIRKYDFTKSNLVCNYFGAWGIKECFPKKWIGGGLQFRFENRYLISFEQYDKFLKQVYGNYMELPPAEERKHRHSSGFLWKEPL